MNKGLSNRQKVQDYAVQLSEKFNHVLLSWATGVGKSLAAIRIIQRDIDRSTEVEGDWNRWYIVCAEKQHISNWEDEFKKHGYAKLLELGYVEIFCYQSLHKYKDKEANLILDEAHGVTDLRLDILKTIKAKKIVSLSATVEPERLAQLQALRPLQHSSHYTITTDQAIKAEMLPKPIVVKVDFHLTPNLKAKYDMYDRGIEKWQQELAEVKANVNALDLSMNLTPKRAAILHKEYQSRIEDLDKAIMSSRMSKKSLLANAKTSTVKKLVNIRRSLHERLIVFTGTTAQCRSIGENNNSVISDFNSKANLATIENFNEGKIDLLVALKMLRQGTNLRNIDTGIIAQLDSKPLSFIQMMGRIFRSENPVLFVFVAQGTVDEKYWNQCVQDLDSSYILTYQEYLKHEMEHKKK